MPRIRLGAIRWMISVFSAVCEGLSRPRPWPTRKLKAVTMFRRRRAIEVQAGVPHNRV